MYFYYAIKNKINKMKCFTNQVVFTIESSSGIDECEEIDDLIDGMGILNSNRLQRQKKNRII